MERIILFLSQESDSDETIKRALRIAEEEKKKLEIVYIIDENIPSSLSSWIMYTGFLGEKPTEEVKGVIIGEIKRRVEERVEEIKDIIRDIKFDIRIEKGYLRDIVTKAISEEDIFMVIYPLGLEGIGFPRRGIKYKIMEI